MDNIVLGRNLNIISKPSPNFGKRKKNKKPSIIVIHYTAMKTATEALALLCDPKSEVSCHYLIDERGQIFSLVKEQYRAWVGSEDPAGRGLGSGLAKALRVAGNA